MTDNSFVRQYLNHAVYFLLPLQLLLLLYFLLDKFLRVIILYKVHLLSLAISGVEPLVIFLIFVKVLTLSPGLTLSGLYPQKKS